MNSYSSIKARAQAIYSATKRSGGLSYLFAPFIFSHRLFILVFIMRDPRNIRNYSRNVVALLPQHKLQHLDEF